MSQLLNITKDEILAQKVRLCDSFFHRLKGLLASKKLEDNEACWLVPCNSIHTFGMRYSIDAYFLNKDKKVVAIEKNLKRNRVSRIYLKGYSVLEFASGPVRKCDIGDQLSLEAHS